MSFQFRPVQVSDTFPLTRFFEQLSAETKSRYGPHPFDMGTVAAICRKEYHGYLAFLCLNEKAIIGYTAVFKGYTLGEKHRYPAYSIHLDEEYDYTFAPCIADEYQSKGIGSLFFHYVEQTLRNLGAKKIVLWGGVQARNEHAVRFYQKNGFQTLGEFHHDGLDNLDMLKYLVTPLG